MTVVIVGVARGMAPCATSGEAGWRGDRPASEGEHHVGGSIGVKILAECRREVQ